MDKCDISAPVRGEPLKAAWAAAVTDRANAVGSVATGRGLLREGAGMNGEALLPQNLREQIARTPPFKVFVSSGDEPILMYLPSGSFKVGGREMTIGGKTAATTGGGIEGADLYALDCLQGLSADQEKTLYLLVKTVSSASGMTTLDVTIDDEADLTDENLILAHELATVKLQESSGVTTGILVKQHAVGSIGLFEPAKNGGGGVAGYTGYVEFEGVYENNYDDNYHQLQEKKFSVRMRFDKGLLVEEPAITIDTDWRVVTTAVAHSSLSDI